MPHLSHDMIAVHDLLIPAFNSACDITSRLLDIYDKTGNGTRAPLRSKNGVFEGSTGL